MVERLHRDFTKADGLHPALFEGAAIIKSPTNNGETLATFKAYACGGTGLGVPGNTSLLLPPGTDPNLKPGDTILVSTLLSPVPAETVTIAAAGGNNLGGGQSAANAIVVTGRDSNLLFTFIGDLGAGATWTVQQGIDPAIIDQSAWAANSVLKSDAAGAPAALTVAEQTLVGRITSGVIAALTVAQVRTLLNADQAGDARPTLDVDTALHAGAYNAVRNTLHRYNGTVAHTATLPTAGLVDGDVVAFVEASTTAAANATIILDGDGKTIDDAISKNSATTIIRGAAHYTALVYDATSDRWRANGDGNLAALLTGPNSIPATDQSADPVRLGIASQYSIVGRGAADLGGFTIYTLRNWLTDEQISSGGLSHSPGTTPQNDYNAGNSTTFPRAWSCYVTPTIANVDITGFHVGTAMCHTKFLFNAAAANTLTLKHENASSTASRRIVTPSGADFVIAPGGGVTIHYDDTADRWRVLS